MRRFLPFLAAVLLLAGCTPAPVAEPLDPDIVAILPPQGAGNGALLVGALVIGDDCVTLETSEEGVVLPVFPQTTVAWDGDTLLIDGTAHADGSPVWLGGGFIDAPTEEMHIPEGCPTDALFLVAG